jgi:hypothetical protein
LKNSIEAGARAAAGRYLRVIKAIIWLAQNYPYIASYLDPPKTLNELQRNVADPKQGYEIHHIAEEAASRKDNIPENEIQSGENLVRVPTLKHWEITSWMMRSNPKYGGLSPREYLKGKSWEERLKVGREALIETGVLKR